jgi:hypothetical protein
MKYNLVNNGGVANITVVVDGEMYVADGDHPNFQAIVAAVLVGDESVVELFDVEKAVATRFEKHSERVSVANGRVYFDGDEVNDSLTKQIVRFMNEGEDFKPLVNFFEKIADNPNEHSRAQFYAWVQNRKFTIAPDGDILAYKGVYVHPEGGFRSVSSGTATVNGEVQNGQIRQDVGDVVEMPRSEVQHDPQVGCHTGLHAGTWEYASTFVHGSDARLLTVKFSPRDVVSVPTDCEAQKVRVSRYTVVEAVEKPYETPLYRAEVGDDEFGDDDESLCDCGNGYVGCCYSTLCDSCGYYLDETDDEYDEYDDEDDESEATGSWPEWCSICNGRCEESY